MMPLPSYFLADRPEPGLLTPAMITEACLALKANRRRYLEARRTPDLIDAVAAVAEDWLDPANPFRQLALARGPGELGFSRETLAAGLDAFFASLTREGLRALVVQDLGHLERLDQFCAPEAEARSGRVSWARGPELLAHITAGRLPNAPLLSLVLGLLTRSAQFMKCASGTSLLPRLFAHSLRETEAKLAACLEIAEWPGGTEPLEAALFAQAECVTVMGTDATVAAVRARVPDSVRFLGYGHQLSFGYVAAEVLAHHNLPRVVAAAARDVVAWNQLGCLSPHAFYVEAGGRNPPERFAAALAEALAGLEATEPRGELPVTEAAAIAARRGFYEVRAAHSRDTQLWCSPGSTAWTVVYESQPRLSPSVLHRFIYVKAVAGVDEALAGADEFRGRVSTVGLAASGARQQALVQRLAQWGVRRICPLGRMQQPPPDWRHDGRPALGELVIWADWERPPAW
ncbi:MAG: hypothetical protein M5U12_21525 [Verrucomicrobia bacterium]|nr:hypothetical protein [Verrucomicrobiota bacterium]